MNPIHRLAQRAKRRWWLLALLRALLMAWTVSALAGVLALLVHWFGGSVFDTFSDALRGLLGVTVVTFVAGGLIRAWRTPSLLQLAALLDVDANLKERLSTALEISLHTEPATLVARAAYEDALAHMNCARVEHALPITWPRWGWAFPAASLLAGGLLISPPAAALLIAPLMTEISVRAPTELAERMGASVDRMVAVLQADPVRGGDPYVQAVAESLSLLADRIRRGEADAATAHVEFDQLMAHLQRAVATRGEDDSIATLVNRYFDQGSVVDDGARADAMDTSGAPDETSRASLPADRQVAAGPPSGRSLEASLEELERALSAAESASQANPSTVMSAGEQDMDLLYGIELNAAQDPRLAGLSQQGDGQGSPAGGATRSDDRPGDAAGLGGQDMDGDGAGGLIGGIETEEDVVVSGVELEGRRRIQAEGNPGGAGQPRTGGATLVAPTPIYRLDEAAAWRGEFSTEYALVVRSYFLPEPMTSGGLP